MERAPTKPDPTGAALPHDGKVRPDELNAAAERPTRSLRNRPAPHEQLQAAKSGLRKRADGRPFPPGVMLEPAGMDQEYCTPPHSDQGLWELQLAEAFGTRSQAVMVCFMDNLEKLCARNVWDDEAHQWRLDEHTFNAALAMVNAVKPRNEMEAALAAQMVAVHLMQMKVSARALQWDGEILSAAVAAKLARAFTDQMRALKELKGRQRTSRQSIKVTKESHQHVHYHDHRGEREKRTQCHATQRAGEPEDRTALLGPDKERGAMPVTSRKGQARMQNARRDKSGRAEG